MRESHTTDRTRLLLLPLLVLLTMACPAWAQDPQLTQGDSAWARFPVGAWRVDEIFVFRENPETGSMDRMETSIVTSRLVAILEDHYVLEVDRQITTGGRSFSTKTVTEKRCFDDTTYAPNVKHDGQPRTVTIPGEQAKEVTAREITTEFEDESMKLIVTSVYAEVPNPRRSPGAPESHSQLIRRRTEQQLKANNSPTTAVEWELCSEPQPVGQPQGADWVYSATQRQTNEDGYVDWTQAVSAFVPGAIVNSKAREYSVGGDFRQGVTTTLVEFGLEPKKSEDSTSVDGEEQTPAPGNIQAQSSAANQITIRAPGRFWPRRGLFLPKGKRRRSDMILATAYRNGEMQSPRRIRNHSQECWRDDESPSRALTECSLPCEECAFRHAEILGRRFARKHPRRHRLAHCRLAEQ